MLDSNNLQAEHIFMASTYIDRMKSACYDYVEMDFTERQQLFKEMVVTAHELIEFSETAFPESAGKIKQLCEEAIPEIHKLQGVHGITDTGNCKICNGTLTAFQTYHKGNVQQVQLCDCCSRPLLHMISALERPTGVWAI